MARGTVPVTDQLRGYMKCEKCQAEFEYLYIGGVGDWQTRITCEVCRHVRKGVPFRQVIVPLIALQYGLSEADAAAREDASQKEYLASVAEAAEYASLQKLKEASDET
jgi:hypothetical protein